MYVRQWAEGFEGGGVQWGGLVYIIKYLILLA